MAIRRWAAKTDTCQQQIIDGLRKYGVHVWSIGKPVDLLCWHSRWGPGNFKLLEVKTPRGKRQPKARLDKRQEAQNEFLVLTATPIVTDLSTALEALGLVRAPAISA